MSTYKNTHAVYMNAIRIANDLKDELEHVETFNRDEWLDDAIFMAADREVIWTQDNWDVCNLFRCSPEFHMAEDVPLSEFETVDAYFACIAHSIWTQLIREAFEELR